MRTDDLHGALSIPGDGKYQPARPDLMSLAKGARNLGGRSSRGVEVTGAFTERAGHARTVTGVRVGRRRVRSMRSPVRSS